MNDAERDVVTHRRSAEYNFTSCALKSADILSVASWIKKIGKTVIAYFRQKRLWMLKMSIFS